MKINNDKFEKFVQEQVNEDTITDYNLIGLMTIWLLDTEEWSICKGNKHYSIQDGYENSYENTDLFTALKDAIEVQEE